MGVLDYKEPRRISINKPIWFIRKDSKDIYWIKEVNGSEIFIIKFAKKDWRIYGDSAGRTNIDTWKRHIKQVNPETYQKFKWSDISSRRKQNILRGVLEYL